MICPKIGKSHTCIRATAIGPVAVKWDPSGKRPEVTRILLTGPDREGSNSPAETSSGLSRSTCQEIDDLLNKIEAFAGGELIEPHLDILRLSDCSEFQQKVLLEDAAIPRGRVSSYGHLSSHLGVPGGARAVGTALATNPFPLVIPCHRVIRSDGSLGGFQGGLKMKRLLLEIEGIQFNGNNRAVNPDFYNW